MLAVANGGRGTFWRKSDKKERNDTTRNIVKDISVVLHTKKGLEG